MGDKAVITCSLNGVLTDPKQHNVPVTPEQMAREAKAAFNAGASVMHVHLRQQEPNKGHLPSWDVSVSKEIQQAIREACPGVIINHTTGTSGPHYQGALDCVRETRPEIAACNAGSLNYLKVKSDNTWAWPPMMFDNAVEKVQEYLDVMKVAGTIPEFECFDVGIVRCVNMYRQTGMYSGPLEYNFVMGVASGMPADPELLPILLKAALRLVAGQQLPVAVVGRGHGAGAHDAFEVRADGLRHVLHRFFERLLNFRERRNRHPQRQLFVEHMVFTHVAVGQHVVAKLLTVAQTRAVAQHDPRMRAQHGDVVGDVFGIRRADADVDHGDAALVGAQQVVGRHLRQAWRRYAHVVARRGGQTGASGHHIAGFYKSHVLAGRVCHGFMADPYKFINIKLVVGEQHIVLEPVGRGAGVVAQALQ